jgi:hypothetical protein
VSNLNQAVTDGPDIEQGQLLGADDADTGSGLSKDRARLYTAGVIGALLAAFALLNLDDVKVHWILGTSRPPLFFVIVIAVLGGVALDRLILRAKRKRASPDD